MNILFDMETGDPDDLITLLLLLNNPDVQLRGVTCYQGSPIQIGLINHVLKLAKYEPIPIGGWNCLEPASLSKYYTDVVGHWDSEKASMTPVEVFKEVFDTYPDVHVLTGAPLTNLGLVLDNLPNIKIQHMTSQGGYLGALVSPAQQLSKFKGRSSFRTYNLGNDLEAFDKVNMSSNIQHLTYVTKDLCHGFSYNPQLHQSIQFGDSPVSQLLKKCLGQYAENGKSKAMHDPLAMLMMLYPSLGETIPILMSYRIDERGHPVFSSVDGVGHTQGLFSYNEAQCWSKFGSLCADNPLLLTKKNKM